MTQVSYTKKENFIEQGLENQKKMLNFITTKYTI